MHTIGIDEVGRGCWAGPLVAGAVLLPSNFDVDDEPIELRDSKKMSKKQRQVAARYINLIATVGLGWVTPTEIDEHGLTWAVGAAMERALNQITVEYDEIIIDGNINYFLGNPKAKAIVRADDSVSSVSAASIVAKVARDTYMSELGSEYDKYEFASHVGYGTARHIAALREHGVSDIHRLSYKPIKALLV